MGIEDGFVNGFGAFVFDDDGGFGVPGFEGFFNLVEEVDACGVDGIDANLAGNDIGGLGMRGTEAGDFFFEGVVTLKNILTTVNEFFACGGEGKGADGAVDEGDAEFAFEEVDTLAGGGLGNAMLHGSLAEAAETCDITDEANGIHSPAS